MATQRNSGPSPLLACTSLWYECAAALSVVVVTLHSSWPLADAQTGRGRVVGTPPSVPATSRARLWQSKAGRCVAVCCRFHCASPSPEWSGATQHKRRSPGGSAGRERWAAEQRASSHLVANSVSFAPFAGNDPILTARHRRHSQPLSPSSTRPLLRLCPPPRLLSPR